VALRGWYITLVGKIKLIRNALKGELLKSQLPIPFAYCTRGHSRVSFFSGFLHDSTALAPHMGHRIGVWFFSSIFLFITGENLVYKGYYPEKGPKVTAKRLFREILN
jgi:hypothetical protein